MAASGSTADFSALPEGLLEDILGYLDLSNGSHDTAFAGQLNTLCQHLGGVGCWSACHERLSTALHELGESSSTFTGAQQAAAVLDLVFDDLAPAYRQHHADLLFHLPEADWEHPLLLVRFFETVLAQGGPWEETERIIAGALDEVNDFLGYRPVAVLENEQWCEPYPHERYRPVPIYIEGTGAGSGPYQDLVARTVEILAETPLELRQVAHFELDHLSELAIDVRAHDHLHPVNKRTTYMFGEWDPHHIDNKGCYRRFVLRQIILDALVGWTRQARQQGYSTEDTREDAAVVLAGTILMASAISGSGPDTHDSTVSLTTLLPIVARLRDAYYTYHMQQATGERAELLTEVASKTQQPFGHVRQQLNLALARYGARQIQHRQLALLYARMGYPDAARQQAATIPAASIRFECEIQCEVTEAELAAERGDLPTAITSLGHSRDLLTRGIDCGALPDPWNYLGFQAQFPLFAAQEDSIPDQRLEDLLLLLDRFFAGYGRALSEAAARGEQHHVDQLDNDFRTLALNWDGYGATIVTDLNAESAVRRWWSASQAARVLATWQSAGAAAGDVAFWAEQVEDFALFDAGPAYAQIVEALLEHRDLPASMGLLMQWLGEAIPTDLAPGPTSVGGLLERWISLATDPALPMPSTERTQLVERFFAFLEANAESYWHVPGLEEGMATVPPASLLGDLLDPLDDVEEFEEPAEELLGEEDDEEELFAAAYDDVTFRDSTDDGFEAELIDEGLVPGTTEFEGLFRELEPRLQFLESIARLWQRAVAGSVSLPNLNPETVKVWSGQARNLQDELLGLLDSAWEHEIPVPTITTSSGIQFDIQLQTKHELLMLVMRVHVTVRRSELMLQGLLTHHNGRDESHQERPYDRLLRSVTQATLQGDVGLVRRLLPALLQRSARQPLLYVPLDAGGDPREMLAARTRQADLQFLAEHLPQLGLLRETAQVLRTAYRMERTFRPEGSAVTEFDRLFRTGLTHVLQAVVETTNDWPSPSRRPSRASSRRDLPGGPARRRPQRKPRRRQRIAQRRPSTEPQRDQQLLTLISQLVEEFQVQWNRHSHRTRLSAAEMLESEETWADVKAFIESYGAELFAAPNLTLGHLRSILHHGTEWFLTALEEDADPLTESRLLDDLADGTLDREDAHRLLRLVYHTIIDRYHRFVEYNTTTTQSDYGEKIFCLLDFLRLEAAYDRDAWNFAPAEIAHEVLAQGSRPWLAISWEAACAPGTSQRASRHLQRLRQLEERWGMRLPALADRLGERLIRPLAVNRMRALAAMASEDAKQSHQPSLAFETLVEEVNGYLSETHGSGIDVPTWLQKLEQIIIRNPALHLNTRHARLTPRQIRHQLATWYRPIRKKTDQE